MTEYAPAAITHLFDTINAAIPSAIMAGVIGDSAHTYGYHRGRDYCTDSGDYSCQTGPDQKGDGQAACALDLSWDNAEDQYKVSQRLLNAKNDSRMAAARSFFGSVDGQSVIGWDYYYGCPSTSDDSHLWHVHLSILRQYANDDAALQKIAAVITGGATPEDDDMPKQMYLYSAAGQTTKLAKAGTWYCVGWDADLAETGGSSLVLPSKSTLFNMTAWLYCSGLTPDANLYWRVQTLDRSGNEFAKFPIAELRGTTGDTDLSLSMVGSVSGSKDTNLRLLVSATVDNVAVKQAWWRTLVW